MPRVRVWGRRTAGRIVDLAAWGVVWGGALYCLSGVIKGSTGDAAWVLLLWPAALPLCVAARLTPRLASLAEPGRRESLAVTLLRPGEYLAPRLGWFGIGAVALFVPAHLVLLAATVHQEGGDIEDIAIGVFLLSGLALGCALAFLGSGVAFWWLCRRRRTDFWSSAATLVYGSLGSAILGLLLWAFIALMFNHGFSEEMAAACSTLLFVSLSVASIVGGAQAWFLSGREYYRFE